VRFFFEFQTLFFLFLFLLRANLKFKQFSLSFFDHFFKKRNKKVKVQMIVMLQLLIKLLLVVISQLHVASRLIHSTSNLPEVELPFEVYPRRIDKSSSLTTNLNLNLLPIDLNNDGINKLVNVEDEWIPQVNLIHGLNKLIRIQKSDHSHISRVSMTVLKDFNGDGIEDLVISSTKAKSIYILMGTQHLEVSTLDFDQIDEIIRLSSTIQPKPILIHVILSSNHQEAWNTNFVITITEGGDVDNDGLSDIIISMPSQPIVYVIFGQKLSKPLTVYLEHILDNDDPNDLQAIKIASRDYKIGFGWTHGSIGDFNTDEYGDIVISSPFENKVYCLFGSDRKTLLDYWKNQNNTIETLPLTFNNMQGFAILNSLPNSYFGWSICSAGDFNDDGYDDFLVGDWRNAIVYLIYGRSNDDLLNEKSANYMKTVTFILNNDDHQDHFLNSILHIQNSNHESAFGFKMLGIGDVNNDGCADILIGSHGEGTVYLLKGSRGKERKRFLSSKLSFEESVEFLVSDTPNAAFGYDFIREQKGKNHARLIVWDMHTSEIYVMTDPFTKESSGIL
jgi:hypothetical protein